MTIQPNITKILNTIHSKRQAAIKLSEAFRHSVFLEMFGDPVTNPKRWEMRKLSDLGSIVDGVPVDTFFNQLDYSSAGGIPIVTPQNIHPFQFVTDDLKFISHEKLNLKNGIFPGDLLLVKTGPTIGNICLFPSLFKKAVLSINICKITPHNKIINGIYLSNSLFLLKDEMIKQTLGSTFPVLRIGFLKALKISLPPIVLQEKFAKIMQKVEHFRAHLAQSEQQTEHLLRSLTQNR